MPVDEGPASSPSEPQASPAASRVERYGRLIVAAIVAVVFVVMVMVTESILGGRNKPPEVYMPGQRPKIERSLRIREWSPGAQIDATPSQDCVEGLERKSYHAELDAQGFMVPSHVHKDPELTVAFFGGSTTECLFMAPEERFVFLMGRALEARTGKRVNALNGGRSGNHTMHSVAQLIGKGLAEKPRFAVSHEAVNDLNILLYYGSYWNRNPSRALVLERPKLEEQEPTVRRASTDLLRALVPNIYDALTSSGGGARDEFADVRGKKLVWDKGAILEAFGQAQRLFVRTSRTFGVEPVLMTQASLMTESPLPVVLCDKKDLFAMGIDYATYRDLHRSINETTRSIAREEGTLLIDLEAQIPPETQNFYDTVHYTAEGSRKVSALITDGLLKALSAPPGESPAKGTAP